MNYPNFTYTDYLKLIRLLKEYYEFRVFDETLIRDIINIKKTILLRHDIDYSIESALNMAKIEYQEGILATYFILPDSLFYNLLEPEQINKVKDIIKMGHKVGLHFDIGAYCTLSEQQQIEKIQFFKNFMENLLETPITSISYHNPVIQGLEKLDRSLTLHGLINCYSNILAETFVYRSDSMCHFRDQQLIDNILQGKYENLQLLIHPEWWTNQENTMDEKIQNVLLEKTNKLEFYFSELKQKYYSKEKMV